MKNLLTKTLFISLFLSTAMQANSPQTKSPGDLLSVIRRAAVEGARQGAKAGVIIGAGGVGALGVLGVLGGVPPEVVLKEVVKMGLKGIKAGGAMGGLAGIAKGIYWNANDIREAIYRSGNGSKKKNSTKNKKVAKTVAAGT